MSAARALQAARAAGIALGYEGDHLLWEASTPPPASLLDLLSRHKAEIITLLREGRYGWSAEDWQAFYDERAAIAEFDGGLSRAEAEAQGRRRIGCSWASSSAPVGRWETRKINVL